MREIEEDERKEMKLITQIDWRCVVSFNDREWLAVWNNNRTYTKIS